MLLQEINRRYGITIVLITHEMSVIQKICHKVAVMQAGRIVEQGGAVFDLFAQPQHPVTASVFVQSVVHDRLPQRVASFLQRDNGARAYASNLSARRRSSRLLTTDPRVCCRGEYPVCQHV